MKALLLSQSVIFDKLQPLATGIYTLQYNLGANKGNIKLLAQ